ncbi:MAG TPA: triose-phosphate isomerase [Burkholderiaceae bacterium]|nr:triose-phosphate isomerase [Burkholderiaceae bacterium]
MRKQLIAANWKMNGTRAANAQWLDAFRAVAASTAGRDVVVCAPYPYLPQLVAGLAGLAAEAGAQDLCIDAPGAHTGDVCGEMLLDVGVGWVIVGHSERRATRGEDDAIVATKAARALALGLRPIACVGETLEERDAGRATAVVERQVAALLQRCPARDLLKGAIAYEPVWAIGTGRNATGAQAQEIHSVVRGAIARHDADAAAALRVLYGGSVKPGNAAELLAQPDIDGALVGGASLVAADFAAICSAAPAR